MSLAMMKRAAPFALCLASLCQASLGVSGCGGTTPNAATASSTGAPKGSAAAPDFTGRDVAGNTFRLSDQRGKVVLLDFWSTVCEPCKAEFPHLNAMYGADRAKGLLVVGVAMDGPETVADVTSFVKRFELAFPVVTDEDSRIASLYNPKKSVLIDRAGHIVTVREGYNPGDEKLVAADVEKALASGAP
jgi:peroxiredoxin